MIKLIPNIKFNMKLILYEIRNFYSNQVNVLSEIDHSNLGVYETKKETPEIIPKVCSYEIFYLIETFI